MKGKHSQMFFLFALILFPPMIFSQKSGSYSEIDGNLQTIFFKTKRGTVRLVLPAGVHQGDMISGTVLAEPAGNDEKKRAKNAAILNNYTISNEVGDVPVERGRWKRKIPDSSKRGHFTITLKDDRGKILESLEIPVLLMPEITQRPEVLERKHFLFPSYLRAGKVEIIPGYFDGDFSTSRLRIADADIRILAESPREIMFSVPAVPPGPASLEVGEGDATFRSDVPVLAMDLAADKLNIKRGEMTLVHVKISGLQGLDQDVPFRIMNHSPRVIDMEGGVDQTVFIRPEDVGADGTYTRDFQVASKLSGSFQITASIGQKSCTEFMLPLLKNLVANIMTDLLSRLLENLSEAGEVNTDEVEVSEEGDNGARIRLKPRIGSSEIFSSSLLDITVYRDLTIRMTRTFPGGVKTVTLGIDPAGALHLNFGALCPNIPDDMYLSRITIVYNENGDAAEITMEGHESDGERVTWKWDSEGGWRKI